MDKKTIKLLIIVAVIISAGLIISQVIKQSSIERQAQMKIDQENKVLQADKAKEDSLLADKAFSKLMINACIKDADDAYWSFMELNGTGKRDGEDGVTAAGRFWDQGKQDKKDAIDLCYKKYE